MISRFLASRGFEENPFASTNADKEPRLSQYFVPPPYFTSVKGDPRNPKSNVIFAPRGGGKTAQKVMLEEYAETQNTSRFLCITYDSFRHISRSKITSLNTDWHLSQVIQRLLSATLALIQTSPLHDLGKSDKILLNFCFKKYLGSLNEAEAIEILKSIKSDVEKVREFIQAQAGNITKIVSAIPTIWGLPPLDLELSTKELKDEPPLYIIERLITIIQSYGYDSVYVLVDRVDEISEFANDAISCGKFIAPLLTELNLLELEGLSFKFFLWDQIEDHVVEAGLRTDRVLVHRLNWSADNLSEMLSRRIAAYSNSQVSSLNDLISEDSDIDLHKLICCLGNGSPRDVIRLVGRIIDEHTKISDTHEPLTWSSIESGIKNYSRERSIELYGAEKINDLSKIGVVSFTIGEIANDIFRVSHQAGRNKIQNLMNVGAVIKSGDIENPGNRPLHQYSIVDPRLAYAVSSYKLSDFLSFNAYICPRCETILVRDGETANCHECAFEFPLDVSSSLMEYCSNAALPLTKQTK